MRNQKGFTVVEMIVSVLILSFLGAVLYTTFSQGLKLWYESVRDRPEMDIDLFIEELTADLRNAVSLKEAPLRGTPLSVEFLTRDRKRIGEKEVDTPARAIYFFDAKTQVIAATKVPYENVLYPPKGKTVAQAALDHVSSWKLEYYDYDTERKQEFWRTKWEKNCFPQAIKMNLQHGNMPQTNLTRVIPLPGAGVCPEQESNA